jgi:radical SAM-linked protein
MFERMLRRTGVELALSQGFHPKAKLSFPLALAVGIEGSRELLEVEFSQVVESEHLEQLLRDNCPPGIEILNVVLLDDGEPKAQPLAIEYRLPIPAEGEQSAAEAIRQFMQSDALPIHRKGRIAPIDARADVEALEISEGELRMVLRLTRSAGAAPREILQLLRLESLEHQGACLVRSAIRWNFDEMMTTSLP